MLKKVVLFIAAVSVILIVVAVVAFPPMHWKKVEGDSQKQTTRTYDRQWELLPLSEWGVVPMFVKGCGPNGGETVQYWRFGFFALSEAQGTWIVTAQEREWMKQRMEGKKR
ncbi:hypothetical protein [Armatimonas rosea]|uniref:Uncharacterized protein n=1 Tax=Armatimonas rosea TaxID=685828 RepID=A0A7W9SQZ2_ARMRO|nr:hypothetical protein [Armatimonas rosea]MBB6050603.1 hypothetical protein [Armatimonas rosea]